MGDVSTELSGSGSDTGPNPNVSGTAGGSTYSPGLGTAGNVLGIVQAARSGTPVGETSAALQTASLANKINGSNYTASNALGAAGSALGVYQGIQQGGVMGYGTATVDALKGAGSVANLLGDQAVGSALSGAAGYVAAPLAVYNAVSNWKQGNTLGNTLNSAEAGAAIGSIVPGIGTAVGAVIGGIVGGVTSLIQGPHTQDEITKSEPDSSVIKLQSGNSALLASDTANPTSGVAYGAGSSNAKGSAQWFLDPAASGTLNKDTGNNVGSLSQTAESGQPNVTKGDPFWIGSAASQDLTNFANSVPTVNGQPNFAAVNAQYAKDPTSDTGIVGVYNNNGGQDAWGMNFQQWTQSVWNAKNGVTGNLTT